MEGKVTLSKGFESLLLYSSVLYDCSLGKVSYELDMGNAAKSDFTYSWVLVILDVYNKTHEIG